jgi:cell division transport system permease protein
MKQKDESKSRLKSIQKSSGRHFFRSLRRIFRYGFIGFFRNIWLSITATIVTTLTLVLLFATIIASLVLSNTADVMRDKIDITIFFKPGTSADVLSEMSVTMLADSNVKQLSYSTSEEEYEKFLEEAKSSDNKALLIALEDDEDGLMKETFLKQLQATMRIKVHHAEDLSSIKKIVAEDELFVANLDTEREPTYNSNDLAISTITSWANIATKGGIALCGLFLVISILVIFNTIRMAIYSRAEEIYMEKLVGADNFFIRGPFLVEAMASGILAGLFAGGLGILIFNLAEPQLKSYDIAVGNIDTFLAEPLNVVLVFLALVGTGMIVTLISSRLAVHKYLKRV